MYCSFDFKNYPFDSHQCELNFGSLGNTIVSIEMNSTRVRYEKKKVELGQGHLKMEKLSLPFDVSLESVEPFYHFQAGFTYSFTGMKIYLTRNDFGQLIGGYYGPTFLFSLLSLMSYTIHTDVVSLQTSFSSLKKEVLCNVIPITIFQGTRTSWSFSYNGSNYNKCLQFCKSPCKKGI